MTQGGKPLSEREKEYIRKHYNNMFKNQIATKLGELFPSDNNGSRKQETVKRFMQREGLGEN